jgi:hypothetical protein
MRKEAKEAKRRHEFQQFEIEETVRTKKKEELYIEGRCTPTNLQNTGGQSKRGSSKPQLNLQPVEEDQEDSESSAPSMAESEHPNSSNKSGYREETRDDSILIVSLLMNLYEQWIFDV